MIRTSNVKKFPFMYLLFCILYLVITEVQSADLMRGLLVPQFAVIGGSVTLSCTYDLQNMQLYSLKWYHNNTEFYRYVPTDRKGPVHIRPSENFKIKEVSRGDQSTTLSLTQLTLPAAGNYRCELIAEHPSFRTETSSSFMNVLREPLYPPIIVGAQESYKPEDKIRLACQARTQSPSDPKPTIEWFLAGRKVDSESTSPYGQHPNGGYLGYALHISAKEVFEAGGNQMAECRLTLGNFQQSTSRRLIVERQPMSYTHSFFSKGTTATANGVISTCDPATFPIIFIGASIIYTLF